MSKKRELTDKQEAFLDALFGPCKGDYKCALKEAGYSGMNWQQVVYALRDEIVERSEYLMALHAPKATLEVLGTLDEPTRPGTKELRDTAKEIWDRTGLLRKDGVKLDGGQVAGVILLPPKQEGDE